MLDDLTRQQQRAFLRALVDVTRDVAKLVDLAQGCGDVAVARELASALTSVTFAVAWASERCDDALLGEIEPVMGAIFDPIAEHELYSPRKLLAYVLDEPRFDA